MPPWPASATSWPPPPVPRCWGASAVSAGASPSTPPATAAPVLVSSTDGVGTKSAVAAAAARYDTIGIDLVAMCVDDIVCVGAEPLFLLDYITTGKLDPDQMEQLVAGVAAGCRLGGLCAARRRDGRAPRFAAARRVRPGRVHRGRRRARRHAGPGPCRVGDVLVGLLSPGLRCNGYTLARHVLLERAGLGLDDPAWAGAVHTVGRRAVAALGGLRPRRAPRWAPSRRGDVHAVAHITGGGMPGNLGRVLPAGADAVVDRGAWDEPRGLRRDPPARGRRRRRDGPACSTSASAWCSWSAAAEAATVSSRRWRRPGARPSWSGEVDRGQPAAAHGCGSRARGRSYGLVSARRRCAGHLLEHSVKTGRLRA